MFLVCGEHDIAAFQSVGRGLVEKLSDLGMIGKNQRLLDVGCGCGRVARYLLTTGLQSYVGFDRHPAMIEWCKEHITSIDTSFQFHHFDLTSGYHGLDGYVGSIEASSFRFPFPDEAFEGALLASVFTHMPMNEIDCYLGNLGRVLAPGGKALASIFLAEKEPHGEEVTFYHSRDDFVRRVEGHELEWRELGPIKYGPVHNWYLLTKHG